MNPAASLRQPRELGQIISTAVEVYAANFLPMLQIAAVAAPLSIAATILQDRSVGSVGLEILANLLLVVQLAVNVVVSAALIAALHDVESGKPPDFGRAYDAATEKIWTLLKANIHFWFHILLFAITLVGIPWAIQRSVRWSFINQTVILEGADDKASLSWSAQIVVGSWWRTAGIYLTLVICIAAPAMGVFLSFMLTPIAISSIASAVVGAVLLPFFVTATTLLYFDLKARKESYDVSLA